ncbi:UvrD-helicase domain-containing protein, partial [Candidatus Omnitrophota bacterium]
MPSFKKFYEELNPEQKEAVDTIKGPLLVLAGPGTGKTQLLSVRAANIIRQKKALP